MLYKIVDADSGEFLEWANIEGFVKEGAPDRGGGCVAKKEGIVNIVAERLLRLRQERERQQTMYSPPQPKPKNFS